MSRKVLFLTSTVGMKYLMGLSGFIWVGFVMAHMLGNLLLFIGPDAYNEYSHTLTSGKIIFIVEAALGLSIFLHIFTGIRLTIKNKNAKGTPYHSISSGEKKVSLASRTMIFQGSVILFFIINPKILFI